MRIKRKLLMSLLMFLFIAMLRTVSVQAATINVNSLTVDKTWAYIGDKVNIVANASGSSGLQYKFWVHDGTSWKVVQDYSSKNTVTWIPSKAASCRIWVDVKNSSSNSSMAYKEILFETYNRVHVDNITTNLSSPQPISNSINISTTAAGEQNLLYRYWIYDGSTWKVVRDYSQDKTFKWNAEKIGTNRIWVDVKQKDSLRDSDGWIEKTFDIKATPKITAINFDKSAPIEAGSTVKITANSEGGNTDGNLYRFWVFNGSSWSIVKDYSKDTFCNWTPSYGGTYRVWVDIKDKNSIRSYDNYMERTYDVNSKISFSSITTDMSQPQKINTNIKIVANASSNEQLLYRFWIYNGQTWKVVQDYSKSNIYVWTPNDGANYRIWVDVKSTSSKRDYDKSLEILYRIDYYPVVTNLLTNVVSPRRVGNTINLNTTIKYGVNPLYRYWIYDGTSWSIVRNYCADPSYSWTPTKEGNYKIWVDVKDSDSKYDYDSYKQIEFTINKYGIMNYINTNISYDAFVNAEMNQCPQVSSGGKWINASKDQVSQYANVNNYINDYGIYQFLKLTYSDGISVSDLNKILKGQGVLEGQGDAFLEAGKKYNVNPIYLVAHSIEETDHGTSQLASGIVVSQYHDVFGDSNSKLIDTNYPLPVYNVYGVGAYDKNANMWGSEKAYREKWFTVRDAIIGGAQFISTGYINSSYYKQDTLYEMRWDVNAYTRGSGSIYLHQYATDVSWAYNQSKLIKQYIDVMKDSMFYFDIPTFNR